MILMKTFAAPKFFLIFSNHATDNSNNNENGKRCTLGISYIMLSKKLSHNKIQKIKCSKIHLHFLYEETKRDSIYEKLLLFPHLKKVIFQFEQMLFVNNAENNIIFYLTIENRF